MYPYPADISPMYIHTRHKDLDIHTSGNEQNDNVNDKNMKRNEK
jgi:hypothetical protein